MIEIGRIVMKIAGRDAGKIGTIIKIYDDNYVLIDGDVRRKKCNIKHLEILKGKVDIKEDASNPDIVKALNKEGLKVKEKKKTEKKASKRPKKTRKKKKTAQPETKKKAKKA